MTRPSQSFRPGLRLRIAAGLALACLLVVGSLGFALYTASEEMEEALIAQIVDEELEFLIQRHGADPSYRPQQGSILRSYIVRPAAPGGAVPAHLRGLGEGRHILTAGGEELHAIVRDSGGARYLVVYKVGLHEQREQDFRLLVLLSVITAVLLAFVGGYLLSGRLISQVAEFARTIERLEPGAGPPRLTGEASSPELAGLARALDDYRERMDAMVRREQEFTANASHELRTPLTAIRTSCELLLGDDALPPRARERVTRMSAAARRMTDELHSLLLLARGREPGAREPVALAACIVEVAEPYQGEIARKGLRLDIAVDPTATVEIDRQALRFVLANLIRNAVAYTGSGFVRIAWSGQDLAITDSGAGIAPDDLPRIFDRFYRVAEETAGGGVGLSIVKRVCDHYGWRIAVRSDPGKGSTFTLAFS